MEEDKNKFNKQFKKLASIFILVLIILSVISFFNICYTIYDKNFWTVLKDTNILSQVTVCFITTVGSTLVYFSFIEQVRFNKLTLKKIEDQDKKNELENKKKEDLETFDRNDKLLFFAFEEIEKIEYQNEANVKFNGTNAIKNFATDLNTNRIKLAQINSTINTLESITELVLTLNYISEQILSFNPNDYNLKILSDLKFISKFANINTHFHAISGRLKTKEDKYPSEMINNYLSFFESYYEVYSQIYDEFNNR